MSAARFYSSVLLFCYWTNQCFCSTVGTGDMRADTFRCCVHQSLAQFAVHRNCLCIFFCRCIGSMDFVNFISRLCFFDFFICCRRRNAQPGETRGTKHILSHIVFWSGDFITTTAARKVDHRKVVGGAHSPLALVMVQQKPENVQWV